MPELPADADPDVELQAAVELAIDEPAAPPDSAAAEERQADAESDPVSKPEAESVSAE